MTNLPLLAIRHSNDLSKRAIHLIIGAAVIAAAGVLTLATAGAGSSALVAAIHCTAMGAFEGAVTVA